mmetsp:Transcript_81604/g.144097  ORF Transcript_81604/g.144097 Transcript_81604/m.144097 type:complete len:304 (-) Transcript_81604:1265-2176(-)
MEVAAASRTWLFSSRMQSARAAAAGVANVPMRPSATAAALRTAWSESFKHGMSSGTAAADFAPSWPKALALASRTCAWLSRSVLANGSTADAARPGPSMPRAAAAALFTSALASLRCVMSMATDSSVPRWPSAPMAATRTSSSGSSAASRSAGSACEAAEPSCPRAVATAARTSTSKSFRLRIKAGTAGAACSPSLSNARAAARRTKRSSSPRQVVSPPTACAIIGFPSLCRRNVEPSGRASTNDVCPAMFISALVTCSRTRRRGSDRALLKAGTTASACASRRRDKRYLTEESGCSSAKIAA